MRATYFNSQYHSLWIILLVTLMLGGCGNDMPRTALGTLERNRIVLTATVSEVVTALPVAKGSQVTKGTLLVKLDDRQQRAQLNRARAKVAEAEANLDKLHNGAREEEVAIASAAHAAAKAALVESSANYARVKNLADQDLASKAMQDKVFAQRAADHAHVNRTKEQLRELTNGTRPEDLRIAEAQLAAAQAEFAGEKKKLADLSIVASRDGYLDNLPWNLGERVTLGSPVAIILAGKAPYARIYVPEPYRVKINMADKLMVRVDGLDKPIEGTVRWISSDPAFSPYYALNQDERARLMYLAEIQLPDSYAKLPNGVPAQVELP